MSGGCYRCGLSEGSDQRLCETCYRARFHKGRDVIDLPPGVPLEGLEFTPTMRTFLLSSGAALYVGLVGFVVAVHSTYHARSIGNPRLEFVSDGQQQAVVRVDQHFGTVRTSHR
jgi:hypothetical protein